jgi:hypothetical protein
MGLTLALTWVAAIWMVGTSAGGLALAAKGRLMAALASPRLVMKCLGKCLGKGIV